jgi:DNA-binding transcriptional ArsR family regulator
MRGLSDAEALARITDGGKVPKPWQNWLPFAKRAICFPNPHLFFHSLVIDRTLHTVYTALPVFIPKAATVRPTALSRSMLKTSLTALADDTRLQMIELLVAEPGLNTKEIQEKLNMSQSAVSRHINQLAGSGFVEVVRVSGVNMYAVNPNILADLHQALKELFGNKA